MRNLLAFLTLLILIILSLQGASAASPVQALKEHLDTNHDWPSLLSEQPFAKLPLGREEAEEAAKLLWQAYQEEIKVERQETMERRVMSTETEEGRVEMKFYYKIFGEPADEKRSLYISLHGGGGTTAAINNQQWENQKRLYEPEEGVYLAPRAPTNEWDLWHKPHIDPLFDALIETLIVFENIDPNRVYLMGYSAGGDGVYQLAPRMADRWAAAAMMAGHPNDAQPAGLRNIGFTIHMGGKDDAYNRNEVAKEWRGQLAQLQEADPEGYPHLVVIYPNHGHWMNNEDRSAVPWMAQFTRNPYPSRVVWKQDNVTHTRFYWLAIDHRDRSPGATVIASYDGQEIQIEQSDVGTLYIRLHDQMVDLDQPVRIMYGDQTLFEGTVPRTIETIAKTLEERKDPTSLSYAEVEVSL